MADEISVFLDVLSRLKLVLDCDGDAAVADRLGLSKTAFNNRKLRGSLPRAAIDSLLQKQGLNPEFIYQGTGPVHTPLDGVAWGDQFQAHLVSVLNASDIGWLVREGHSKPMLAAVVSGKQAPSMELLRDFRKVLAVDLNALFCDEPAAALNSDEEALIAAYRKVSASGKEFIRNAAGMASQQVKKKPSPSVKVKQKASGGGSAIQIGGSVDSSTVFNGEKNGDAETGRKREKRTGGGRR